MMQAEFSKKLSNAFGYMTAREVDALKTVAGYAGSSTPGGRDTVMVNIGAGAGTSALALREADPFATIYTVDISEGGPLGGLENERNAFRDTDLELPTQILGDSAKTGREWRAGEVDLVFIDGGHLRPEITADILSWLPNIRKYGYVAFHDYTRAEWPDVKPVVDEYFGSRKPIIQVDTFIAFRVYGNELYPKTEKQTAARQAKQRRGGQPDEVERDAPDA